MKTQTVCVKLTSGEEIFAELVADDKDPSLDEGLIKLYLPYTVSLTVESDTGTQFMMRPWSPFSDDKFYYIPGNNVVNISKLDDYHTQIYGSQVTKEEINDVQDKILAECRSGILSGTRYNDALETILGIFVRSSVKYGIAPPPLELVEKTFVEFIFNQRERTIPLKNQPLQ